MQVDAASNSPCSGANGTISLQAHEQAEARLGEEDQPLGSKLAPGGWLGLVSLEQEAWQVAGPGIAALGAASPTGSRLLALLSCVLIHVPPQLENLSNFIKAMTSYGMNPVDLFEANDLFESGNMTQVQVSLLALAGMVSAREEHGSFVTVGDMAVPLCHL